MKMRINIRKQINPEYQKYHDASYDFFDDLQILSEESAELIQACSKLARVYGCGYFTTASKLKAMDDFEEEIADVLATISVTVDSLEKGIQLDKRIFWNNVNKIAAAKEQRFIDREKEIEYQKSLMEYSAPDDEPSDK